MHLTDPNLRLDHKPETLWVWNWRYFNKQSQTRLFWLIGRKINQNRHFLKVSRKEGGVIKLYSVDFVEITQPRKRFQNYSAAGLLKAQFRKLIGDTRTKFCHSLKQSWLSCNLLYAKQVSSVLSFASQLV